MRTDLQRKMLLRSANPARESNGKARGREKKMERDYEKTAKEMMAFIEKSPCSFHVIANIKKMLEEQGFIELRENDVWRPVSGKNYYIIRGGASLIAFRIPDGNKIKGFHGTAAHSDSPAFKIKENPEIGVEKHYVTLNTEKYGGMILGSWLDRPLSVAGRVVLEGAQGLETRLVNIDRDLLVIPGVAIHMNRDINKGVAYDPQKDMLPLYGEGGSDCVGWLLSEIAEQVGAEPEKILGHDLFLYVREQGRIFGRKGEFILSPRLDDLQCVYACIKAFGENVSPGYINFCAVFDHEEVGSRSGRGADSTFLEDTLYRLCSGLGLERTEYLRMLADSFLISTDNAHAMHPDHPEKSDPTNRPCLNAGIVIKYHGGQKYTTDACSAARMKRLCRMADVPFQTFANRSDLAGGSTLGNLSAARVPMESVDIGLPQLSMHSAVETAGVRDTWYLESVLGCFFGGQSG